MYHDIIMCELCDRSSGGAVDSYSSDSFSKSMSPSSKMIVCNLSYIYIFLL